MRDISLHLLDIVQNALRAQADTVFISLTADWTADSLRLEVADNGRGMSREMASRAADPFVTGRPGSRFGLGLSLLEAAAERTGGSLSVIAAPGAGTKVCAVYRLSHIDRPPLGDLAGTVLLTMICNPTLDFVVAARLAEDGTEQVLDTREMRAHMDNLLLNEPDVASWIRTRLDALFPAACAEL